MQRKCLNRTSYRSFYSKNYEILGPFLHIFLIGCALVLNENRKTVQRNEFPGSEQTARASVDCSADSRRSVRWLCVLPFLTLENRTRFFLFLLWRLAFFSLSRTGEIVRVNNAVITTNCNIKVGWRPFVRAPSLVSAKVDTSWPMKSPF